MNQLADKYILEQDFDEDCLSERTQPGTKYGECTYHSLCGCFVHETYKEGFDAASAEYEKIIAELEGALIFYANGDGDVLDWDRVNDKACIQDRGKTAKKALQSIEKFLEGK